MLVFILNGSPAPSTLCLSSLPQLNLLLLILPSREVRFPSTGLEGPEFAGPMSSADVDENSAVGCVCRRFVLCEACSIGVSAVHMARFCGGETRKSKQGATVVQSRSLSSAAQLKRDNPELNYFRTCHI